MDAAVEGGVAGEATSDKTTGWDGIGLGMSDCHDMVPVSVVSASQGQALWAVTLQRSVILLRWYSNCEAHVRGVYRSLARVWPALCAKWC